MVILLMIQPLIAISNIEQIWQLSWRHGFYRGGPVFMSALAGIDMCVIKRKTYVETVS